MKRCLWVVPKLIFPVSDGARVANQSLIKSIRPHFEKLDIIVFREKSEEFIHMNLYKEYFYPDKIHILEKPAYKGKITKFLSMLLSFITAPSLPLSTSQFSNSRLIKEIRNILNENYYDLLVLDGLHPFSAFLEMDKEGILPPLVYRAHNVEQDLWIKAADKTENPLNRFLLLWQGRKVAILERYLIEKSKRVWAIDNEDQKRFEEITGLKNINHIPVGLDFQREKVFIPNLLHSQKIKLLFAGKLDWAPNKDGLRWFLHEVWPFINHEKLELNIVGNGDYSWVENFFSFPGIRFHGLVQDLSELYCLRDFSIIPIRFGSGIRLNVIESISKGVPVISTPMGVQGSGLEEGEFILASGAQEWINILNTLEIDLLNERAQKAFLKFEKKYSPEIIGESAYLSLQT